MKGVIRILLVDDHAIMREGLKRILAPVADMAIVADVGDGHQALALIRQGVCDMAVVDISMPAMNGMDLIKRVKDVAPVVRVLVLSMHKEDQFAMRALRAGASGYLTKESASDRLVEAIRKVASGGMYVSPPLAEKMAFELNRHREKLPHERLSDREFEVLRMIVEGKSVNQIADALSLSAKTISTHKARLMRKMDLHSVVELVHYALQHRLFE